MQPVQQQIARARRRLSANILLDRATLGMLVGAGAFGLLIVTQRLLDIGVSTALAASVGGAVAVLIAIAGTLMHRVTPLRAAVALDEAAGLRERLSTALLCGDVSDPFARAAAEDADRVARKVHVPVYLPLRRPRLLPWSGAAVGLVLLLTLALPQMNLLAREAQAAEDPDVVAAQQLEKQRIKSEVAARVEKLEELTAKNPQLANLDLKLHDFQLRDQPDATPEDLRRDVVRKIDNAAERLEEQRKAGEAAKVEAIKRQLARLDNMQGDDAASKLSQALSQGDMKKASAALKKLQKELEKAQQNPSDPQAKAQAKELGEKIDKLAKQLDKLGDSQKQLAKDLQRQGVSQEQAEKLAEQLQQSGQTDPNQIQQQLQKQLGDKLTKQQQQDLAKKISQQQKACQACKNLGKSLSQAAQSCQQGQQGSANSGGSRGSGSQGSASASLNNAASQLSDLEAAEQLANDLQLQLSELSDLRNSVCKPGGDDGGDKLDGKMGFGMGEGIGGAPRPDKKPIAHNTTPIAAKSPLSDGAIIGEILVDSPPGDEEAQAKVQEAVVADKRDAQNAIERNRYPRQYHKTIREYFERYGQLGRGGK